MDKEIACYKETNKQLLCFDIICGVDIDAFIKKLRILNELDLSSNKLLVLENAINSRLILDIEDLEKCSSLIKAEFCDNKIVKHAVVIDNPIDVAKAIVFSSFANNVNYEMNIFSTKETAINWLKCFNNN